jgi:hypothetical protein
MRRRRFPHTDAASSNAGFPCSGTSGLLSTFNCFYKPNRYPLGIQQAATDKPAGEYRPPRQQFHNPHTSMGSAGHWIKTAGILAPLIIGELVKDADKRWRYIRMASVATALVSEGCTRTASAGCGKTAGSSSTSGGNKTLVIQHNLKRVEIAILRFQ